MAGILGWAGALETSALGDWMRSSALAYPVANVLHLLGLVLLLGPILLLDMRLLGAGRQFPLLEVSRVLTAWAVTGLLLLIGAGFFMFAADAGPLLANRIMQLKLVGIALGLANAIAFRALWHKQLAGWDLHAPWLGRAQAGLSVVLWLAVATLGRWIAYA